MILNNTQKVLDYNSKLSAAATDFASSNFKQVEEVFEKSQISETIANLSSQANQVFREQLDAGLSFLAEVLAENSYAKILQTYQAYDFNVTEQFLQEYELSVSKWSIAYKVMRCISGTTVQWRQALHPSNYASLVERLSLNISRTMFSLIIKKKFTQIGSILLSKEVQYFVESLNAEMDYSVGREFGKLHEVSDLLVCDSLSDASKVPLKFLSKDEKTLVLKLRS
jgi:hypothetical protein